MLAAIFSLMQMGASDHRGLALAIVTPPTPIQMVLLFSLYSKHVTFVRRTPSSL
jgi:hypothetical protein